MLELLERLHVAGFADAHLAGDEIRVTSRGVELVVSDHVGGGYSVRDVSDHSMARVCEEMEGWRAAKPIRYGMHAQPC